MKNSNRLFRYDGKEYQVKSVKDIGHILYKRGSYLDEYKIIPSCVDDSYYHGTLWTTTFSVYASEASRTGIVVGYCNFYEKGLYLIEK